MNLGKIYCINLAHRQDRWRTVQEEFNRVGINDVHRFDAIPYVQRKKKLGFIGCALSHLALIEKLRNEERFTIFEDDVRFIGNPLAVLEQAESQLPSGWDVLYLGANPQEPLVRYSDNLYRLHGGGWCTHAMIFNQGRVTDFILRHKAMINKIDVFYANILQKQFNVFITHPLLATQADGHSDVTGIKNDYFSQIIDGYKSKIV